MEEQLQKILNDPQTMQQLMSMAQSLGGHSDGPPPLPDIDPGMLQKISGLAGHGTIDPQQRALLKALAPYLSRRRISKLENAMRAAKMARFAASVLGSGAWKGG